MNRWVIISLVLFCVLSVMASSTHAAEPNRQRLLMDMNWKFNLGDVQGAETPDFNDSAWRGVDLPHDYGIEGKVNKDNPGDGSAGYFPGGLGWYRRTFTVPQSWNRKRVGVEFGGVYMNADVWINGQHLGSHPYGYTAFYFDLTPHLRPGEKNVLAVCADNTHFGNTRWYSGSGIYRHVWLNVTEPVHVAQWGTCVTTPEVSESKARAVVQTVVRNDSDAPQAGTLTTLILDSDGNTVASASSPLQLAAKGDNTISQTMSVAQPKLWMPETPTLYKALSRVTVGDAVSDEYQTPFGIRTLKYSPENGFQINGRTIKLCGGCIHHDNGCLGAAAFDRAEERRIELLKAAGFNAVRSAHNPPSEELLDACDRLGMLVMDESFDCWEQGKNIYDYSVSFKRWWRRDMDAMVLRDRNHPSVIMWSIGNEIPGRDDANGLRICKMLADYARTLDATRATTSAVNWSMSNDPFFANLEVGGYNYNLENAAADHGRVPSRVIVCTEPFPNAAFDYWQRVAKTPYIIGDFVWTALDYIGESGIGRWDYASGPNPLWHGSWCGDLDSTCYRKPVSHYRNIVWDRGEKLYMAIREPELNDNRISLNKWAVWPAWESWTWPGMEGKDLTVVVYSRYDKVRLYLNDKLLGEKPTKQNAQYCASFTAPFAPGTLKAAGVQGDKEVGEYVLRTAGDAAKIRLSPDRANVQANSQDLSYVTVEVLDKDDRIQPNAENIVKFSISGPGAIAGMDNGDMRDDEPYKGNQRKVFHGRAIVVIRTSSDPGDIKLTASAEGLAPAAVTIQARPGASNAVLP
ncbi:MAG: glycoside hydrolase family 2 TIM barrel-domain containing protein [Thermoguttaceae bacterium]